MNLKMAGQTIKICFQPQSNYKFLVNKSQNFRVANVATAVSRLLLTYTSRLDVHETGNHIAQMSGDKFAVVNSFADIIEKTINSETPWVAFNTQQTLWTADSLRALIARWKDTTLSGQSLGDASIVDVASYYSKMGCPVEIFTGDQGLKAYEPQIRLSIPRRRQSVLY